VAVVDVANELLLLLALCDGADGKGWTIFCRVWAALTTSHVRAVSACGLLGNTMPV
jgi:hypothetical protein